MPPRNPANRLPDEVKHWHRLPAEFKRWLGRTRWCHQFHAYRLAVRKLPEVAGRGQMKNPVSLAMALLHYREEFDKLEFDWELVRGYVPDKFLGAMLAGEEWEPQGPGRVRGEIEQVGGVTRIIDGSGVDRQFPDVAHERVDKLPARPEMGKALRPELAEAREKRQGGRESQPAHDQVTEEGADNSALSPGDAVSRETTQADRTVVEPANPPDPPKPAPAKPKPKRGPAAAETVEQVNERDPWGGKNCSPREAAEWAINHMYIRGVKPDDAPGRLAYNVWEMCKRDPQWALKTIFEPMLKNDMKGNAGSLFGDDGRDVLATLDRLGREAAEETGDGEDGGQVRTG